VYFKECALLNFYTIDRNSLKQPSR